MQDDPGLGEWSDDSTWENATGSQSVALGHQLDQGASNPLAEAYQAGRTDAAAATRPLPPGRQGPASTFKTVRHQASGFLLGGIAAALVMSYVKYGPAGPKSWVAAKFWNAPSLSAAGAAATTDTAQAAPQSGSPVGFPGAAPASAGNATTVTTKTPAGGYTVTPAAQTWLSEHPLT